FGIDPWLFGLMASGLLLRVGAALWLDGRLETRGDEFAYLINAKEFFETGVLETGVLVRPPLYFVLIAGVHLIFDPFEFDTRVCVRILQCLASVATAVPVYLTAKRVGSVRIARLAVAFLMFDPTVIAFTHLIWPETFFLFIVAMIFHGVASIDQGSTKRVVWIGVLVGLALLLKPAFGLFTLVLAGQWLWRLGFRPALRLLVLVGGTAAVVISPWVIRNQIRYGPEILMVNQVPYNLWIGNDPGHPQNVAKSWLKMDDPVERSRMGMERGFAAIADDPGRFARNFAVRVLNLWGLEFHVVRHLMFQGYGRVAQGTSLLWFWFIQGCWAIAFVTAVIGARTASRDPTLGLLLVYAVIFTAVVSTMVATTRFRIPFAFPLVIASAVGVDRLLAGRLRRAEIVAAIASFGWLLLSFSRPVFQAIVSGEYHQVSSAVRATWRFFRY
ncbi:MAG: glycosyltransferase family 39 protein, partial [Myxococcales bacterium]|nr:glycosyltransferase family 39 protein [Myxococcales bacterium]